MKMIFAGKETCKNRKNNAKFKGKYLYNSRVLYNIDSKKLA